MREQDGGAHFSYQGKSERLKERERGGERERGRERERKKEGEKEGKGKKENQKIFRSHFIPFAHSSLSLPLSPSLSLSLSLTQDMMSVIPLATMAGQCPASSPVHLGQGLKNLEGEKGENREGEGEREEKEERERGRERKRKGERERKRKRKGKESMID